MFCMIDVITELEFVIWTRKHLLFRQRKELGQSFFLWFKSSLLKNKNSKHLYKKITIQIIFIKNDNDDCYNGLHPWLICPVKLQLFKIKIISK